MPLIDPNTVDAVETVDAVILLARGGTGAAAREAPQRLADELQPRLPGCKMLVAFVDKAAPSLPQALDLCVGARMAVVLPLLLGGNAAIFLATVVPPLGPVDASGLMGLAS